MKNTVSSKILITTSRNPTQLVRTFCNDLTRSIPNSLRINRGKSSLNVLAEEMLEHDAEKMLISDRWKGGLGRIQLFEIGDTGPVRFYPIIYVKSIRLRRTFGYVGTKIIKPLILQTETKIPLEAQRLADAFSQFLNIKKLPAKATIPPDIQAIMQISLNTTRRTQITFFQIKPRKTEVGPRITISHLIWSHENEEKCGNPS